MNKVALTFGAKSDPKKSEFYFDALRSVGLDGARNPDSLEGFAGLLLPGGTDIEPAMYGAALDERTQEPDLPRDALEKKLLQDALARNLPVFAICRGQQLLNAVLGGTLTQHIENHSAPEAYDWHKVKIVSGSRLASILQATEYSVNSSHHQCVAKVAPGLIVTATSSNDNIIEALEFPAKRFVFAVQWHPERRIDGPDARLFEAFRNAVNS
jgi:gamma-glutamyl-gamma-aminobutyrate hydrolase PuuD